jgi:hypothetical protein
VNRERCICPSLSSGGLYLRLEEFQGSPQRRAFGRQKAVAKHRSHSVAFKRQVAQEFLGDQSLHG